MDRLTRPPASGGGAPQALSGWGRLLVDFGPLLVFLVAWSRWDIYAATAAFMAATAAAIAAAWLIARHVPPMLWFSGGLVALLGGLTLWLDDPVFIKMKPTLVFLAFASALAFGAATGRNVVRMILAPALPGVAARGWHVLALRLALFFAGLAALNEALWRFFPEALWVHFKVWGDSALLFLFMLAQWPMLRRHGLRLGHAGAEAGAAAARGPEPGGRAEGLPPR